MRKMEMNLCTKYIYFCCILIEILYLKKWIENNNLILIILYIKLEDKMDLEKLQNIFF